MERASARAFILERAGAAPALISAAPRRSCRTMSTPRPASAWPRWRTGFDGADVVQTHMTNSRLTDPEVLEWRFPVLLESFAIRDASGGRGRWRGGHGAVRRIRFLEPMTAAILSGRRLVRPHGLAGGEPGMPGRNYVIRAGGRRDELGPFAQTEMAAGDVFVIETPRGGGDGPAAEPH